jgi:hypothetical protein
LDPTDKSICCDADPETTAAAPTRMLADPDDAVGVIRIVRVR